MPFSIVARSDDGSINEQRPTAREALDVFMDYRYRGYRNVEVRDERDRRLAEVQLLMLVAAAAKAQPNTP